MPRKSNKPTGGPEDHPAVLPFRGYRYDPGRVGDLSGVVTQPYDKIDRALQKTYLERSPYNLAWVIRSPEKEADPETAYPEAGARLRRWMEDGILKQDPVAAFYPYRQCFRIEGREFTRRALIALVDLEHGRVQKHERTHPEPRLDRLRLQRATEANEGLIFLLARDPSRQLGSRIAEAMEHEAPLARFRDEFDVRQEFWRLTDTRRIRALQDSLRGALVIADGHHRYETSLAYSEECRRQGWRPAAAESFDKRLVAIVDASDPGVMILPTHRLLRHPAELHAADFLQRAARFFSCDTLADLTEAMQRLAQARRPTFAFHAAGLPGFHLLTLRQPEVMETLRPEASAAARRLDVVVLHALVLDTLLGIDEFLVAEGSRIGYERDAPRAVAQVGSGECRAAFLLNPTRVDQVMEIAGLGEQMPQKSTDFFPKMLSGLVLMSMKMDKPSHS